MLSIAEDAHMAARLVLVLIDRKSGRRQRSLRPCSCGGALRLVQDGPLTSTQCRRGIR
jgi:hypothetical protein